MKLLKRLFGSSRSLPEIEPNHQELDHNTREKLRKWLESDDTKLALGIVQTGKPSVFWAGGSGTIVDVAAHRERVNNQYHMIRGWESCIRTIQGLAYEKPVYVNVEETFPAEGEI